MISDRLSRASAVFADAFERKVGRPLGLRRHEYVLLRIVHEQPGITSAELAHDIGVSRPCVTKVVDELHRRGLVTRTTALRDRRAQCLEPSAGGSELVERATALAQDVERNLLAGWTSEERQRLLDLLGKLISLQEMRQRLMPPSWPGALGLGDRPAPSPAVRADI